MRRLAFAFAAGANAAGAARIPAALRRIAVAFAAGAVVVGASWSGRAASGRLRSDAESPPRRAGAARLPAATRDRPPTAFTGGFGEPTCQYCHSEAAVNAGAGRLVLDGVPQAFEPGAAYPITLTVVHGGARVFGFELAARFERDGTQAGSIAPAPGHESRAGVTVENGVAYAHHLRAGTIPASPGTACWQLVWTSPGTGGSVSFHAVANAGNDDDSPLGDYVYSAAASSPPAPGPTARASSSRRGTGSTRAR